MTRSRTARAWSVAITTAIFAITSIALTAHADSSLGPVEVFLAILLVDVLSQAATIWTQSKGQTENWQPFAALLTVALILLPPAGVVTLFSISTVIGLTLGRLRPYAVIFNAAQVTTTVAIAAAIFNLMAGGQSFGPMVVVAALVAAAVDEVVNQFLLALFFGVVDREPVMKHFVSGLRFAAGRVPPMAAMGVLAGAAGLYAEWAALFALIPMGALHVAVADHLRAKRDRERISELLEAANDAHASVRTDDVREAVLKAAARMLNCEHADFDEEPPSESGAWGVELSGDMTGRWLVVRDRKRGTQLEPDEQKLFEAFAAISSSALENAKLVEHIQHQALHDTMTGLPNQVLFEDRVSQLATASYRNRERFAVAVLDLDHFKKINDSLGHSSGNDLLKLMADRLLGAVREVDTVARLGGDHFTLLLPGIGNADVAAVLAETLLASVRRPVVLSGHELFMTASLGIAFFPDDGTRPEHLLRNADSAMHRAKDNGRDTFQAYASGMNELAHMRLVREGELHNAVDRDELRLRYQPQIDLLTGQVSGVESLVRWQHPVLGLIGPHEFIPLAEETGLIVAVDTWVLNAAARQAKRWLDQGLPPVRVAANLSGRHFYGAADRLVDMVSRALMETGLPPELLELEVTEGIAVGEDQEAARVLQEVRDLGVKVAIDDFGMGYSMLGRLQSFPIDRLKIDRSFVNEIQSADGEAPIVEAMIALCKSLKMECVAEGIERTEQVEFLRRKGCDTAQGYLFGHPEEPEVIERLLRAPAFAFNVGAQA